MDKLITITWENDAGESCYGDAIVEFTRYDEDGKIVNEILNIFLPEGLQPHQLQYARI